MLETRIKICGITSVDDARMIARAGADYLGLIFADSARRVDIETARAIRAALPSAMLIGVFQDAPLDDVVTTGRECGLNLVQLHGSEPPEYCDALLGQLSRPVIKAFSVDKLFDPRALQSYTRTSYFLIDLSKNYVAAHGLNGHRDTLWSTAAQLRSRGYRIFLAGGLNPGNVREAIRRVDPFGIDVASGVEKSPGRKDLDAVARFVEEARQ